jgi:hypothetical protein
MQQRGSLRLCRAEVDRAKPTSPYQQDFDDGTGNLASRTA